VGTPATGAALLERVLDVGRAVASAELLGIADEVFDRTVQYLKERKQFDKAIGEFQALQHRAAELFCDLELTRAIVRQALAAIDAGAKDTPLLVAQAKARACLTANRAVQEAVQMHGGIGMTDELDIGLFMKRARVLQELFGDASVQMDRAASLAGY
jgi:acyl-CoA dehydrogenase